jgi:leucyl aminopeptidase
LVGKGVCFDTGGLDIKPSQYMRLMKKDMGGAAHVLGLAKLVMQLQLPIHLRVLIPAVDNAIGGDAFRPGDILATRAGKHVEVDNTDAEGRLVLCDALADAVEQKPQLILDFATLTGAARVALGTEIPVFFSNSLELTHALQVASAKSGELIWNLPLHKPYFEQLKSNFADFTNSGGSYGGAITAALFLNEFVPKAIAWGHFDVMAWNTRERAGRPVGGEAMGLFAVYAYLDTVYRK